MQINRPIFKETTKEFIFVQDEVRGMKQTKSTLEQLMLAIEGKV